MGRRQCLRSLVFAGCVLLSAATPVWMGYYECAGAGTHYLRPSECASSPVYNNASQYWSILAKEGVGTLVASVNGPAQRECFPPECVNVTSCSLTVSGCHTAELKAKDQAWQFVPVTVVIIPKNVIFVGRTAELVCQPGFDSTDPAQQHEPARWEKNGNLLKEDQHHKYGHVEILNVSLADSGTYVCVLPGFRSKPVKLQVRIVVKALHDETLKAVTGVLIFFAILIVGGTIILCMRCRKPKPPPPLSMLSDLEELAIDEPVTVSK